jgi:hypothetical protein
VRVSPSDKHCAFVSRILSRSLARCDHGQWKMHRGHGLRTAPDQLL